MSVIGTKRTSTFALHMSAFDPKRTFGVLGISGHLDDIATRRSVAKC